MSAPPGDPPAAAENAAADAVTAALFAARFEAIAREMGELVRRTALSVNVKERLDFSCAVLDPAGRLVVNAPHIPVHLGALGLCVRRVTEVLPLGPGDVAVVNSPAFGGSHLPDVTTIEAVYEPRAAMPGERTGELLGYVATRAHHAEIGGTRPGSLPPDARTLAEEGVVLAPRLLVAEGRARWDEMRRLLEEAPWPSRAVAENLADLEAAVAAGRRGAEALSRLAAAHGRERVAAEMARLAGRAAERTAAALGRLGAGVYRAREELDDGSPIVVEIRVEPDDGRVAGGGRARVSFAGSAGVHPGNLNAPPAVVRSALLYVLRLLIDEPLPLNEGLLEPIELDLPPGMLAPPFADDPRRSPAVGGGNTETSQRVVDTLLRALGLAACSQGTMNNVLFGDRSFGYYETLGGGCGAVDGRPGASGVHSHMTNTRITDPEVLELRYPVRLRRFALRRGSGGAGRYAGGDGLVRELEMLAPVEVSVLGQHRRVRPYGAAGGAPGAPGRQRLVRSGGEVVELAPVDGVSAEPGDRLIVETPGGGGWGRPEGTKGTIS